MRVIPLVLGIVVLAAAWLGPLPDLARQLFSAHMAMHMAVVAVAAPLIALGLSGSAFDPSGRTRVFRASIPASVVELIVVWAWHAPVLHHAARQETWALIAEQGSFVAAGLFLWVAALGGRHAQRESQRGAGVAALLFTSMHMTLLGALFALAPRSLYLHAVDAHNPLTAIGDQHLGGAIMLLIGGTSYLVGGLCLTAALIGDSRLERRSA
jgi:putative membrane protein